MKIAIRYFVISVVFWFVVDYTTVFNPQYQRWFSYMPTIFLFYFGYPLIFTFIVYFFKWEGWKLFLLTLGGLVIVEIVFTRNALLYTFPIMLIMIPISICIYVFITFTPKWIAEGRVSENKKYIILVTAVWLTVAVLSWMTRMHEGVSP